jgi:mono/diheme cytochrome c family protein
MTIRMISTGLVSLAVLMWAAAAPAQTTAGSSGSSLFRLYCASCHGTSAKGDGPLASAMKVRPPDLTRIAERNKGVFSADDVSHIIDGRKPVKGHGGGEMPVWGDAFAKSGEPVPVEEKIARLVNYLQTIQVKP